MEGFSSPFSLAQISITFSPISMTRKRNSWSLFNCSFSAFSISISVISFHHHLSCFLQNLSIILFEHVSKILYLAFLISLSYNVFTGSRQSRVLRKGSDKVNELEQKIYETISEKGEYRYSSDMVIKSAEIKAVDSLQSNGYISIKAHALGFVIADAF